MVQTTGNVELFCEERCRKRFERFTHRGGQVQAHNHVAAPAYLLVRLVDAAGGVVGEAMCVALAIDWWARRGKVTRP